MKRPQRADRYEAQLTDGELMALHQALLTGRITLARIQNDSPPWREGPQRGKRPSLSTLSGIRDRLVLEETFRENESTTEKLLEELKAEQPELTDAQIDAIGQRAFKTLTLRQLDVKSWVALQHVENDRQKAVIAAEKLQIETCEKFVKWANDQRALAIANSTASNADKIAELRKLMFQDVDGR